MRTPEQQRAWDIMVEQRERRREYRCGLDGRWEVPRNNPHAVPACSVHASTNMIAWTDAYRYAESYLMTMAVDPKCGPELLEFFAGECDLALFPGVERSELEYVLELLRFWGLLPTSKPAAPRPLIIFGKKVRVPIAPEQRWDGGDAGVGL